MKKLLMLSTLILLQACASVKTGNQKFLDINSHPEGAEVWVNGEYVCDTPCKHDITGARNEIFEVSLQKDGYRPYQKKLEPKTDKEVETDLIMCIIPPIGLTMLGVDYYTGSMWSYEKIDAVLTEDILAKQHPLPSMQRELSQQAKEYVYRNFAALKEEAFSSNVSQEKIRTLSSLTSVPMERLVGMVSEAQDAAQMIEFLLAK